MTYAKNTLAKTVDDNLKTLLVDMLNYGSQAQIYFDYHTELLANSFLTEEQKALGTEAMPDLSSCMVEDDPTVPGEGAYGISILGATLSLKDKVEINYYIAPIADSLEDKTLVIVCTNGIGREITVEVPAEDFVATSSGLYKVTFDQLAAKDMRIPVTCWLKDEAGNRVSNALTYSIESYAASKVEDAALKPLLLDMMRYGDSAQRFFNPQQAG